MNLSSSAPSAQIPCTVIIKTRNEAHSIARCIASVANFDQVVVVDSQSTDETESLARAAGAESVSFAWNGRYPKKVEWCYREVLARHSWVLFIDADEVMPSCLEAEIAELIRVDPPDVQAAEVELDYCFLGRRLRRGHRVRKRVLLRVGVASWPRPDDLGAIRMGELEGHYQPQVSGRVLKLKGRLSHDDEDPLFDYFARHNKYSDWEAWLQYNGDRELISKARTRPGEIFSRMPFKPLTFFAYSYLFRLGFLDGGPGLHYALSNSFYYWQTSVKSRALRLRARVGEQ